MLKPPVVLQRTAKKCTKIQNTRRTTALLIKPLSGDVPVAVAVAELRVRGGYTGTSYLPGLEIQAWQERRSKIVSGVLMNYLLLLILLSVIIPILIWIPVACPMAYLIDFLVGDLLPAEGCAGNLAGNDLAFEAENGHE